MIAIRIDNNNKLSNKIIIIIEMVNWNEYIYYLFLTYICIYTHIFNTYYVQMYYMQEQTRKLDTQKVESVYVF